MKGLAVALALLPSATSGEPLGWVLGVSNDSIGEFRDRWQSSSVDFGVLTGPASTRGAPKRFGEILEYRFRSDILSPEDLDTPDPDDRRHAGVLAFGMHSHAARGPWEARIGGELVVVGPQTGLLALQEGLHELLGFTVPRLDAFQIENTARLDLSGEVARRWQPGAWQIRPFAEARFGAEDLIRLGFDATRAPPDGGLALRTVATGQRLTYGTEGVPPRWSPTLGADIAWVADSLFLPGGVEPAPEDIRIRARAGARFAGRGLDFFYGLTWLGEEFEGQRDGQFVGTVQLRLDF